MISIAHSSSDTCLINFQFQPPFCVVLCLPPLSHTFYSFYVSIGNIFSNSIAQRTKFLYKKFSIDDAKINFSLSNKNNNFEGSFLISRKFLQKILFMELSHAKDFLSLYPHSSRTTTMRVLSVERWNNSIRYNGNSSRRMRLEAEMRDIKRWDKIWSRVEVLIEIRNFNIRN